VLGRCIDCQLLAGVVTVATVATAVGTRRGWWRWHFGKTNLERLLQLFGHENHVRLGRIVLVTIGKNQPHVIGKFGW